MTETKATSPYLLKGAIYALEQCGRLLGSAQRLYCNADHSGAVVFAAFAREELGRARILFDLRSRVLAGESVTIEMIHKMCADHVRKQEWAMMSTLMISTDGESGLGQLLQASHESPSQSDERKAAAKELEGLDEIQRKRAPYDRHRERMRALYVEPNEAGTGWNRPSEIDEGLAYQTVNHARDDYMAECQKLHPEWLKGHDDQLLKELTDWSERPELPYVEGLRIARP